MDEMLRSELQRQGIFTTTLEELYNWGRKNSIWPLGFGLACCAIEMIATSMARWDAATAARVDRFVAISHHVAARIAR